MPTFKILLEFIYTDNLVKFGDPEEAIEILVAANKYGLERLKRLCEKHLVEVVDIDNVLQLLIMSDMHQAIELRRMCMNYALTHFDIITKKEEINQLSKSLLLELIQNK